MALTRRSGGLVVGLSVVTTIAAGCSIADGFPFSNDRIKIDNRTTRPVEIHLVPGLSVLVPACGHVEFDPHGDRPSSVIGYGASVPPDAVEVSHEVYISSTGSTHIALWITPDGVQNASNEPLPPCAGEPPVSRPSRAVGP